MAVSDTCNFCRKSEAHVELLIASPPGPTNTIAYICNECVHRCLKMIKQAVDAGAP